LANVFLAKKCRWWNTALFPTIPAHPARVAKLAFFYPFFRFTATRQLDLCSSDTAPQLSGCNMSCQIENENQAVKLQDIHPWQTNGQVQ